MIASGIDLGTAAIKIVFTDGTDILWSKAIPTQPQHIKLCEELFDEGLKTLSLTKKDLEGIASTGYGRKLYTDSNKVIDEITANALGAYNLSDKKAKSIINIGGQDIKVIKVSPDGHVIDFKMNDKCAAGTGRFFEMAARILNTSVQELGDHSILSESPININSMCAVFAESEIVSLLAMGKNRNDIIAGLHKSVARRVSELITSMYLEETIYLDGGPAKNQGLRLALQEEIMMNVEVLPRPQFTVAFGAAISVLQKQKV